MTVKEYQVLATRTMSNDLDTQSTILHALHGMAGEVGEIHSIYQKEYQGHPINEDELIKEVGDLLWFIAEFCSVQQISLEHVMRENIEKLKKRYPEGFDTKRSIHREEGNE